MTISCFFDFLRYCQKFYVWNFSDKSQIKVWPQDRKSRFDPKTDPKTPQDPKVWPQDPFGKFHPAVVAFQPAIKRELEFFEFHLLECVPVHELSSASAEFLGIFRFFPISFYLYYTDFFHKFQADIFKQEALSNAANGRQGPGDG